MHCSQLRKCWSLFRQLSATPIAHCRLFLLHHSFISFDFYSDFLSSGISVGHFERTKFIRPWYIHTFLSISNFILCKAQHTHICLSFYVVVAKMAFLSDFQPSLTQSVHLLAMYFTCMRNFLWNKSKTYRKDQGEKYYINRFENA